MKMLGPIVRRCFISIMLMHDDTSFSKEAAVVHSKQISPTRHLVGEVSPHPQDTAQLKIDEAQQVSFAGLRSYEELSGRQGAMMYSGAGGAAGLFAQLFAHAAIVGGMQNSEEKKRQREANLVLEPFQSIISAYTQGMLREESIKLFNAKTQSFLNLESMQAEVQDGAAAPARRWILESRPAFFMTADKKALLLQNVISVQLNSGDQTQKKKKSEITKPIYQNVIEVASKGTHEEDLDAYWKNNNKLLEETSRLYALSLDLAVVDILNELSSMEEKDRTLRYLLGQKVLFERGRVLATDEERVVIRTLRGWVKSVPAMPKQDGSNSDLH